MTDRTEVTNRFAELVRAIASAGSDEVTAGALRAVSGALAGGGATISTHALGAAVGMESRDPTGEALVELASRMAAHSVRRIEFHDGVGEREVLALAALVAGDAVPGDEGIAFDAKLMRIAPRHVTVTLGQTEFVRSFGAPPTEVVGSAPPAPVRRATPVMAMPAISPARTGAAARAPQAHEPHQSQASQQSHHAQRIMHDPSDMMYRVVSIGRDGRSSVDELIGAARDGLGEASATRVLFDLATFAEAYEAEERWDEVVRILAAIIDGEGRVETTEVRRAHALAFKRLAKPTLLRALARALPRHPEHREDFARVLARAEQPGADVLIDLLTESESSSDRRAYLSALRHIRAAVPTLVFLLDDDRWYVVRNAAELLGEMTATESEGKLLDHVSHPEERVRRAVAGALARFGTPRALVAAQEALRHGTIAVRLGVVAGLAANGSPQAGQALCGALEHEQDFDVQLAIIAALGRVGSADAVAKLVQTAAPETGLFRRKKPLRLRLTAIHALGESGTPRAAAALQDLARDDVDETREAAVRALRRATEGPREPKRTPVPEGRIR